MCVALRKPLIVPERWGDSMTGIWLNFQFDSSASVKSVFLHSAANTGFSLQVGNRGVSVRFHALEHRKINQMVPNLIPSRAT